MEGLELIEQNFSQFQNEQKRSVQSQNDTTKLLQNDLNQLQELVRFGMMPGGVMSQISMRILDDVDKGPIATVREQFALRSAVEKDVMKLQNFQKKLAEEQKTLFTSRTATNDRIDKLDKIYVIDTHFKKIVATLATRKDMDSLSKRVDKCAIQEKMLNLLNRLEKMIDQTTKRLNADFMTREHADLAFKELERKF